MEQLLKLIQVLDDNYYNKGVSSVSDPEYNAIRKLIDSYHIGSSIISNRLSVNHTFKMKSIKDFYDIKTILSLPFFINKNNLYLQPKIDGCAICAVYEYGVLKHVSTRGNGDIGMDVTKHFIHLNILPLKINNYRYDNFEIRGELYIPKNSPELKNIKYSNLRNLVPSVLKTLDLSKLRITDLKLTVYALQGISEYINMSYVEKLVFLQECGFSVIKNINVLNIDELHISSQINIIKDTNYDFEIDGVVFISDTDVFMKDNSRYYNDVIAYKFEDQLYASVVTDITHTVGKKTNRLTPIVHIKPVVIDNVVISKINLFNDNKLKELNPQINDVVTIRRRGKVFPEIVSIVKQS